MKTILILLLSGSLALSAAEVTPVDDATRTNLNLDPFYQQQIKVGGFAIVSSDKVSDFAMKEAASIVGSMLKDRPDVLKALNDEKVRLAIMAIDEFTSDVPEHSDLKPNEWWDKRARGLGPTKPRPAVSCGEENLLKLKGDPYFTENILVHEFAHAIHHAINSIDKEFEPRLKKIFESAMKKELWKGKYAASNFSEYWAECVQSYFGDNRENDHDHNHVNTRPELKEYDPDAYALVDETFKGSEWQYVSPLERKELAHLEEFDRENAPEFAWPERLKNVKTERFQNRLKKGK